MDFIPYLALQAPVNILHNILQSESIGNIFKKSGYKLKNFVRFCSAKINIIKTHKKPIYDCSNLETDETMK